MLLLLLFLSPSLSVYPRILWAKKSGRVKGQSSKQTFVELSNPPYSMVIRHNPWPKTSQVTWMQEAWPTVWNVARSMEIFSWSAAPPFQRDPVLLTVLLRQWHITGKVKRIEPKNLGLLAIIGINTHLKWNTDWRKWVSAFSKFCDIILN